MNKYYKEVSFNKTSIAGNILDHWVDIPKNMSYYGNYSNNDHSLGAKKLLEDTISLVDDEIDFYDYDSVMVVHCGDDEANSRNETDIWSFGWWDELGLITNDGVVFQQGAVVSEKDPLGMYCHEFGHILGLLDLYNYNESAISDFVGPWGVMGNGVWNDNGKHPSHPVSWSKIKLGWIDPPQIVIVNNRKTVVRVEPLEKLTIGILVIKIPIIPPNIYYLVEVRRRILYDSYLPSAGILVTLINETRSSGQGIVRVMDAINGSTSLADATFETEPDKNALFFDYNFNLGIVVLNESDDSYEIHITSYLNGKIAKEARDAIYSAEKQIDVLKDSKIELLFTISKIDLSEAIESLQCAKIAFHNQNYIMSIEEANQATFKAITSELILRAEEREIYYWFLIIAYIIIVIWIASYFVRK